jgi:lon-related putative ATP-dependent protease
MANKPPSDSKALTPELLSNRCDPTMFPFKNTDDIHERIEFIGQQRAFDAIRFGIGIKHEGYNLYALGSEGIGKHEIVTSILKQEAIKKPTPSDWCYVFNFKNPRHPLAIQLPHGLGNKLKKQMEKFIDNLASTLPAIFETVEHQARIKQINVEVTAKQKEYFDKLQEQAEQQDMTILSTSKGFVAVPIRGGKVLTSKDLNTLSKEEREHTEEVTEELNEQLSQVISNVQKLHKKRRKKEKDYERDFALDAMRKPADKVKSMFKDYPQVIKYIDDVQDDIATNVKLFLKTEERPLSQMWGESHPAEFQFSRYSVNVIIDNSQTQGAPIIYEDNPRDYKLFGRIEHVSQFGALVTDFTLIRQGSLHRANGGYLLLDVHKLLDQTTSWEALKRSLMSKEIKIELPPHLISVTSTSTLEAESIPLDIKIILIGTRDDYYYLRDTDSMFNDLFKVAVDFEETLKRSETTLHLYAKLIATQAKNTKLKPLDRSAIARVIDQGSRKIEDSERISLNFRHLKELLEEADHWAEVSRRVVITVDDVQHAIDSKTHRLDHHQQLVYDDIQRDILLINTVGKTVGQINALTTYRFGEFIFGFPSRVTATARLGREGIIDIEREVNLSGPIHAKGILILSGFLRGRYAKHLPMTLSASIVFEQSYSSIDGDSASVAELCTLLSALADIPIKQNLAVTGSVNQHGLVQAIGNVNEKIEGFYEVCKAKGLTGEQGVIIPKSNVQNLMLNKEIVTAVEEGKYKIYAIDQIDQAISLLLGKDAGARDENGQYREGTVNYFVERQLIEFAKITKKWTKGIL